MWLGVGKGKGGAGCTTAVLELAHAASRRTTRDGRPRRVVVLDLDPQGDATEALAPAARGPGIKAALTPPDDTGHSPLPLRHVLVPTSWDRIWVAPADRYLANRESDLTPHGIATLRRARLSGELEDLADDVIIDLPRHLGKLSATGLLGIERLFITSRPTMWSAQGAEEMRYSATRIAQKGNPELEIAGFIVSAFSNTGDERRVLKEMRARFGRKILSPMVPRCTRASESLESYHIPCREYGDPELVRLADVYQKYYDRVLRLSEGVR
ncbi:ParA family protein [Streptomyces sp. NPDC048623]|uniref:ParA family protein n=1 Tax=Streptomyces sp. NPDC048623 TaxID=3155761 RepID=UPI003440F57D